MRRLALTLAALAAAGAFGVIGLALALVGAGLPYLAATVIAALLAGCAAYAALDAYIVRPLSTLGPGAPGDLSDEFVKQRARLAALEAAMPALRHDLRGLLSPAILVSDRLIAHQDPKVARAGETVVRAITRAADRLAATRNLEMAANSTQKEQTGPGTAADQHHGALPEKPSEPLDSAPSA